MKAAFEAERLRAEEPLATLLAQALVSAFGIGRDTAGAKLRARRHKRRLLAATLFAKAAAFSASSGRLST